MTMEDVRKRYDELEKKIKETNPTARGSDLPLNWPLQPMAIRSERTGRHTLHILWRLRR